MNYKARIQLCQWIPEAAAENAKCKGLSTSPFLVSSPMDDLSYPPVCPSNKEAASRIFSPVVQLSDSSHKQRLRSTTLLIYNNVTMLRRIIGGNRYSICFWIPLSSSEPTYKFSCFRQIQSSFQSRPEGECGLLREMLVVSVPIWYHPTFSLKQIHQGSAVFPLVGIVWLCFHTGRSVPPYFVLFYPWYLF